MKQGKLSTNDIDKMLNMREQAITRHQKKSHNKIDQMYNSNQISPRTYKHKRDQIEKWVEKEREEVQISKKQIEDDEQKTARMIYHTQQNIEQIQRLWQGDSSLNLPMSSQRLTISKSSNQVQPPLTDEKRSQNGNTSKRDKSHLLSMIYDRDHVQQQRLSDRKVSKNKEEQLLESESGDGS